MSAPDVAGAHPTMTRWLIVTGGGTALGAAGLIATYLAIRADLPPRVASHWGLDGVDATQDPAALVATLIAVNLGCLLLLGALAAVGPIEVRRPLAMTVAALTGVLMIGVGGTLWAQRGLADPYAATDATRWLALGFAAAAPLAGLAYWLLPTHIPTPRDPLSRGAGAPSAGEAEAGLSRGAGAAAGASAGGAAARFELPSEPLVGDGPWIVPVPAGVSGYVIAGLLGVLALGLVTTPARWVATPLFLMVALGVLAMTRAQLVIDAESVRVRSLGRITWLRVPVRVIRGVEVAQARPMADFGGYGLRYTPAGRAFITRPGPALKLRVPTGADTWISLEAKDVPTAVAAIDAARARQR